MAGARLLAEDGGRGEWWRYSLIGRVLSLLRQRKIPVPRAGISPQTYDIPSDFPPSGRAHHDFPCWQGISLQAPGAPRQAARVSRSPGSGKRVPCLPSVRPLLALLLLLVAVPPATLAQCCRVSRPPI